MDVDDRAGEALQEDCTEQLHVAGQHDQAGAPLQQPPRQRLVAGVAVAVGGAGEDLGGHPSLAGAQQGGRIRSAGGDGHDPRLAFVDGVEQGLQVGAHARDEDRDGKLLRHAAAR